MPTLGFVGKDRVAVHAREVPFHVLERVAGKGVLDEHGTDAGNGQLWLIETKGNDRNNEDSRRKRELGAQWAARAGEGFRYFMVFEMFESVDVPDDNAFTFERFKKLLGGLA